MQSALGVAPRALAARCWLRGLGVTLPCPHAAPSQHQDPQARAVYRQTPQQSRWLSASAATANKMPVPSTGVAPQGGVASTAVEKAERMVDALQAKEEVLWAKKEELWAEKKELKDLVAVVGPIKASGHQITDVAHKERLWACGIDVENTDNVVAGLEERLKSVAEEMRGVRGNEKSVAKQLEAAVEQHGRAQAALSTFTQTKALLTAEGLRKKLPRAFRVRRNYEVVRLLDRDEDVTAVKQYLAAVQEKSGYVEFQGEKREKFVRTALYLVYAVKGGGKTSFLRTIAHKHAVEDEHGGAGLFVSYNETTIVHEVTRGDELRCFAVHLLRHYGVPDDVAKRVASLDAALAFMRKSMQMKDLAPLTICVDEIAVLDSQEVEGYSPAQATIRALMQYQDSITNDKSARGRVYFIFSSRIASYVNQTKTGSSRVIVKHGLKNLREESAMELLSEVSKNCVKKYPAVRMIFKSLAGHPRAVEAFNTLTADIKKDDDCQLLEEIIMLCKFDQD